MQIIWLRLLDYSWFQNQLSPQKGLWDHYIKNIITGTFYDIACHVSQGDRNVSLNFKKTFLLLFSLQHENIKREGCHRLEWVVSATFSKVCNRTSCWEAWAFKLALYWVESPLCKLSSLFHFFACLLFQPQFWFQPCFRKGFLLHLEILSKVHDW